MLDDGEWLCCQCGRYYYSKSMLAGAAGHRPSVGRRQDGLSGPAGAGRVAVTAPSGPS